jgi:hypothetical protein
MRSQVQAAFDHWGQQFAGRLASSAAAGR